MDLKINKGDIHIELFNVHVSDVDKIMIEVNKAIEALKDTEGIRYTPAVPYTPTEWNNPYGITISSNDNGDLYDKFPALKDIGTMVESNDE